MAEQQSNTASDSSRLIVDDAFEVAPVNDRLLARLWNIWDGVYMTASMSLVIPKRMRMDSAKMSLSWFVS